MRGRALLPLVLRHRHVLMSGVLLGVWICAPLGADTLQPAAPPSAAAANPAALEELTEIVVQTTEPKFVAPTRRDRIGRIWAPVFIDGKGPYRLVLDTGANNSAITAHTAQELGTPATVDGDTRVTGITGSAVVHTIHVGNMEVGDLLLGPANLPVLSDVFGGAEGVLGPEGLTDKRIYADFVRDRLVISHSHGERARRDFTVVPLRLIHGLLVADVLVGTTRAKAIIDTGAQSTIGNLQLRNALMRYPPRNAAHSEIIGVTLDVQRGDYLQAPDIDFGHLKVHGIHVTFGDMYLFQHWGLTDEPALTLGMDLLGTFEVMVIDYRRHELQLRLHNGPEPL